MKDHLLDLPLTRQTLETVASPEALHRFAMKTLPDLTGRSTAIRKDTGTLFRVDLPSDRCGTPGHVRLRYRGEALDLPDSLEVPARLEDGMKITAQICAMRRKTTPDPTRASGHRIHATPVSDATIDDWAAQLLQRHGMRLQHHAVSAARNFGRPPSRGPQREAAADVSFVIRDITATITVTDLQAAHDAYLHGIGRGRAYGLGMIIPLTTDRK